MIRLLPIVLTLFLSACSYLSAVSGPSETTLADLEPVSVSEQQKQQPLPQVSLEELAGIYQDVLEQQQDPATRLLVLHRLADIELLGGEADLAVSDADAAFFAQAISAYEALLQDAPDYPFDDRVLYQLSKAYDLSGETDKSLAVLERLSTTRPDSQHVLEAEFRRAERYFVLADYSRAEATYTRVVVHGPESPYYIRALYMEGWSRFKQDKYQSSIASFTGTLDRLVPDDNKLEALTRGDSELAQDSLRVLAIVFSSLQGTQTIASAYAELGVRPYQHLLYEALGNLYLSQERYRDSAETYKAFGQVFPDSNVAHLFQMRVIEAYEAGGFAEQIIAAKQGYVAAFGVGGEYWKNSEASAQDIMRDRLGLFIEELASYYHALAQSSSKAKGGAQGDTSEGLAARYYASAGDYYQLFLDSFPDDQGVPEMAFLLAETRFEAGNFSDAITAYEWVAYSYPGFSRAPDAGYSAILAYDRLAPLPNEDMQLDMRRARVDSELRFVATFSDEPRAPAVLGDAASELLQLQEYQAAIVAASTLTQWQPQPVPGLLIPAWLVSGHAHFQLQQYVDAEQAYQEALTAMPPRDQRYADTVEHIAAAIYRQAEEVASRNEDIEAARQFHRVIEAAPESKIRINAQFDAASAYMRAGDLEQANNLLIDFRRRYPTHELSDSIGKTLVANYQQLEQWGAAAAELDTVYAAEPEGEQKRQALLVAAEYYDKVGEQELAIARYRTYAHNWPQPLAENMEAMNRLAQIYQGEGAEQEQRFWLKKMMLVHDGAGAGQTARSRYLAAYSSSVIAGDAYSGFQAIKLSYPLKKSLQEKKQAMDLTLGAYSKTNAYGIEQFSTQATYRIASIYQQLGSDLLDSERPVNLDALALEQYELMLEEQAYPFEEKAIAIYESNARRSWDGVYDEWVKKSFAALARILPARYQKLEDPGLASVTSIEAVVQPSYPDKVDAYNLEAIELRKNGHFEAAEQVYLAALAAWEPHAATHRNIGILYDLYRGEQDKALRHFNRYQVLTGGHDRMMSGWVVDLERRQMLLVREAF